MFEEIPGNVPEDSGGMFKKIPGNVGGDFGESKFRFIL